MTKDLYGDEKRRDRGVLSTVADHSDQLELVTRIVRGHDVAVNYLALIAVFFAFLSLVNMAMLVWLVRVTA